MVEVVGEGARRSRTYAITDAGREELRTWMLETEPNRAQRNETRSAGSSLGLLDPADRRVVLERELAHAEAYARCCAATAEQHRRGRRRTPFRPIVDLGLRTTAVMREWLREQLDA